MCANEKFHQLRYIYLTKGRKRINSSLSLPLASSSSSSFYPSSRFFSMASVINLVSFFPPLSRSLAEKKSSDKSSFMGKTDIVTNYKLQFINSTKKKKKEKKTERGFFFCVFCICPIYMCRNERNKEGKTLITKIFFQISILLLRVSESE